MMKSDITFDGMRHAIGAVLGPLSMLLICLITIPGMEPAQQKLLAVLAWTAIWWICEPVPIPVTSLLGPTLCVLMDIAPMKDVFSAFANPMIFLFMGGFMLAKAMMVNGLDKRIAYGIMSMKWVGDSPKRIFIAMGVACMMCSGWISNTATAAMMFPISLGLLEAIRDMMAANGKVIDLKNYKYATGLMLMTAYACSIGGVLTPIGTPPNLIMMGFLETLAPGAPSISFFDWMIWGFVAMVGYFVIAYAVLWRMFPADVKRIEGAHEFIEKHRKALGKWNRAQVNTMIAFMAAVAMWVAPGILSMILGSKSEIVKAFTEYMPEELVAMIGGLMLFLLPVDIKQGKMTMTWKDGVEGIEWGTLLLFGGGLAMGSLMYTTGLSTWVGAGLRELMGGNPSELVFVTVFCVAGLLISELTSHTAATNLLAPIAISTALSMGMNPIPVAVGLALAASLGFMMPVSTPPNAIVYASGYIPITKMIKSGALIDLFGIVVVTVPVLLLIVKLVMG
ncbi:MAG: DASS family sodium-coupled anion symporter [Prevotella sp.]|nr:DASS family sodium-coupled anion symporter [Prevotella sp.]